MSASSLKFGTSGLRGLAVDLQGQAARRYTAAFLRHLGPESGDKVYLGRDFRASSAAIQADCATAIAQAGLEAVDCGPIPTPALALHAMAAGCAAIMVTGSHIPADRNGLKFYRPSGEITKADEMGILAALRDAPVPDTEVPQRDDAEAATERYVERFATLLPEGTPHGLTIGVFEHSTVARDLLVRILERAGATVVRLGRRDDFVAVDTEAFGDAVFAPLAGWIVEHNLDAIVSADGDGDRPLLMDRTGDFVRGDVLGLLAARYLGATCVVTPVTSNSAVARTGFFETVLRTKVGSPYVIEAMEEAAGAVVGFEANGGTLVGRGVVVGGHPLPPLPTRDAILPMLCALGLAVRERVQLDQLVAGLGLQHALADRLQNVPGSKSSAWLQRLATDPAYADAIFEGQGIAGLSTIDGLQFRTLAGDTVHFRASGNAPELRVYVEGGTADAAQALLDWAMAAVGRAIA